MRLNYPLSPEIYDEFFVAEGIPRPHTKKIWDALSTLPLDEYKRLQGEAEHAFVTMGITFVVYGDEAGTEKIMPFDLLPRVIPGREWDFLEEGLKQRVTALNLFLQDIYNDQKILKDGVLPKDLVLSASCYRKECEGLTPPKGIWIHITGTDLIRGSDGVFRVLEDNLRSPSGVSYLLENRELVKRAFPTLYESAGVRPVDQYPDFLVDVMEYASSDDGRGRLAVLTPGIYNSAYFEHSFLARKMGIELVEGQDLVVIDDQVFVRTTRGLEKVDGIYRRIDDDFLDPEVFRADSLIGVPGLMRAYRRGKVALLNAPGTGVADDKAVYAYVPDIIRYYLDQDPLIPIVETYICHRPSDLNFVLNNLDKLVVKAVDESGAYGMLMGHQASEAAREEFARKIKANPRKYIAQPVVELSQAPTFVGDGFEGRRVDLRPYILYGREIKVIPGGLCRVALKKGSLVVNSSQGGGSKDTWVLSDREVDHA